MNKSFIIAAVVLGLLATGFTYYLLTRAAGTPEQRLVKVVKTKQDLALGAIIRAEDLELQRLKLAAAPKGSLVSLADAVGKATTKDIPAGTVLTKDHVAPAPTSASAAVREGMRAFAITVESEVGAASLVRPGDRIDILYLDAEGGGAQVVAQDVRVLELPDAKAKSGKAPAAAPDTQGRIHLVVEVTPDQAATLFTAHTTGVLSVALRNRSDSAVVAVHPVVTLQPPGEAPRAPAETSAAAPSTGAAAQTGPVPSSGALALPPPLTTGGREQHSATMPPGKQVTIIRGGKRETIEVKE